MKKKNIFLVALLLALFAIPALAQKAARINFKRGTHSAVLTGALNGYKSSRLYLIRVKEGQTMKIETLKGSVSVFFEGPAGSEVQDMAADCHGNSQTTTTKGEYKLTVQECTKADPWKGTFKVRVTVQ